MKTKILYLFAGIIIGSVLGGLIVFRLIPSSVMIETESPHDFETTVTLLEETAISRGWSVPRIHDLQGAVKSKINREVDPVKSIDLCNPQHAVKILERSEERIVSCMMPCRIAVYVKNDGKTCISGMNSKLMSAAMGGIIKEVMSEAFSENEEMIQEVIKK